MFRLSSGRQNTTHFLISLGGNFFTLLFSKQMIKKLHRPFYKEGGVDYANANHTVLGNKLPFK
jgi:hypothetical protein